MQVVYTIGNFIPVQIEPENFNTKRSRCTYDYWDLTLLAIYEYYMSGNKSWLGNFADWFGKYGTGQIGWDSFVEKKLYATLCKQNKKC